MLNLIINKSLYEVLPLILPLNIPQCLIVVPHMHTQVSLVLLGEVYQGLRVNDVGEEIEALAHLFRVVDVRRLITRLAVDAAMDRTRVDLFEVHNLLRSRRQDHFFVRIVNIRDVGIDVFLGLTCLQNQVFVTIRDFSYV